MARKKVVKEVPAAPVAPEAPVQPMPAAPDRPVVRVYMAPGKSSFWHPDQNKWIPDDINGIELEMDGWLRSQIKAGYVKVVGA
jgi:hypothetical protein